VMNRNMMNSTITAMCLGAALNITSVWAAVEFDCIEVANNAGDNVDFECIPRRNDIHFKSSDIIDLILNLGNKKLKVTIALDYSYFEDRGEYCLSANLDELEKKGTGAILPCEWNQKDKSVKVSLDKTNNLRRRGAVARCWSRRSFRSRGWRCRWRKWDCEPINFEEEND
jgi:hypothetical protein